MVSQGSRCGSLGGCCASGNGVWGADGLPQAMLVLCGRGEGIEVPAAGLELKEDRCLQHIPLAMSDVTRMLELLEHTAPPGAGGKANQDVSQYGEICFLPRIGWVRSAPVSWDLCQDIHGHSEDGRDEGWLADRCKDSRSCSAEQLN